MSLATPFFWFSESIPAEFMDMEKIFPNMWKYTISLQSSILTQISVFNNISVIFGSWFTAQCPRDPTMMPTVPGFSVSGMSAPNGLI